MTLSRDQFASQVVATGLVPANELQAALAELPDGKQPRTAEELATLLVRRRMLTAFQAQWIYAGKGSSLILGNYEILDKLGQGGMGMVLKARHRRMKRTVALKVLSPAVTKSREAVQRFQREVEAAAKLEHPNIVTAHDADEANGTHFLVMQYIEGSDLNALVREQGSLPVHKAVSCILQAARGLEYAHARGVVHRDIKPANLLLDRSGTMKILDMGLARLEGLESGQEQLTGTGQIMGTIDYMAPEQGMDTRSADARADIYSLGATLWFLLTGRVLFDGDTVVRKLVSHQNAPVPSLQAACPSVSAELEAVLAKMLAKLPEARYQTMAEVIGALENCVGHQVSTPTLAAVPGDDTRLEAFLKNLNASEGPRHADGFSLREGGPFDEDHATASTIMVHSALRDTDPQTEYSPTSQTNGKRPSRRRRTGMLTAGGVFLLLAGYALTVGRSDGALRVEINDPSAEVAVAGTDLVLTQADRDRDVPVPPGERVLVVRRGPITLRTDAFVVPKGQTVHVRVDATAGALEVRSGERLLGRVETERSAVSPTPTPVENLDRETAEWILSIGGVVGIDDGLPEIRAANELPERDFRLTWAGLSECSLATDETLPRLRECQHLLHVELSFTPVTDAGMVVFRDWTSLRFLGLVLTQVGDAGLAHCSNLENLTYLNLGGTRVTDTGLASFRKCRNLRQLFVSTTRISDVGMAVLENFTELTVLQLHRTTVTDAGLLHLRHCRKLESLKLHHTQITDKSLPLLAELAELKYVDMQMTGVTREGVHAFHERRPDCRIEWNGGVIEPSDPAQSEAE